MARLLRALALLNGRFAAAIARTLIARPRDHQAVKRFADHAAAKGFEFTQRWTDDNIDFAAPLLRRFAQERTRIDYLEIGAYEGRSLAFIDHLLPGKVAATVVDPWFDGALNSEPKYHAVEPRFARNRAKLGFDSLKVVKGFSTYELPRMLQAGEAFDLIYVDGSHTAWAVLVDLAFCAAMLRVGGLMILDDYWLTTQLGGPGVKPAVDRFHGVFRDYFEIEAVYRQVALRKIAEIPR
ncbi:MAG TPA: class I SAM-dependent methyltransferase [Caulobacteraceae bacterium]